MNKPISKENQYALQPFYIKTNRIARNNCKKGSSKSKSISIMLEMKKNPDKCHCCGSDKALDLY